MGIWLITLFLCIGKARVIINMYKNGFTVEQMAAASNKDLRRAYDRHPNRSTAIL